MKHVKWLAVSLLAFTGATACDTDGTTSPGAETFRAVLNGANERPNPVTTPAAGTATFNLSEDQNTLTWTVTMTGTNNVTAAHIHVGGPNVAGPIILFLYPGPTANNPAIAGTMTRAAFVPPASSLGITFDSLLELLRRGDTYVNVHTDNGVAPSNTGPGDFPGGEIRGQITRDP